MILSGICPWSRDGASLEQGPQTLEMHPLLKKILVIKVGLARVRPSPEVSVKAGPLGPQGDQCLSVCVTARLDQEAGCEQGIPTRMACCTKTWAEMGAGVPACMLVPQGSADDCR